MILFNKLIIINHLNFIILFVVFIEISLLYVKA